MSKGGKVTLTLLCLLLLSGNLFFYPKWNKPRGEATISWDVAGYYAYLPALFINQDIYKLEKTRATVIKYKAQEGDFYCAYEISNGNWVMKYTMGNAILYAPFFLLAHAIAWLGGYPPDGFSMPYQMALGLGCVAYACFSLLLMYFVLRRYFDDKTVLISLALLVLATNYLEYASISNGLVHNQLFFVYACILFFIDKYYRQTTNTISILLGCLVGLAFLIRPTEVILLILIVCWRVSNGKAALERIRFFWQKGLKSFLFLLSATAFISIQLVYWKMLSGHWIQYTYGDQGFDWLHPHVINGLISYRKGWLIYTPVMIVGIIGFIPLVRYHRNLAIAISLFMTATLYTVFAWSIWWYASSLGQRAMVQSYSVMLFPICAFISWVHTTKTTNKIASALFCLLAIYLNLSYTWVAHKAIHFEAENMTKRYFWRTLGRWSIATNDLKLLDTDEDYPGSPSDVKVLWQLKTDSVVIVSSHNPKKSIWIDYTGKSQIWLRAGAYFSCSKKEWNTWQMPQWKVSFYKGDSLTKSNFILLGRLMDDSPNWQPVYLDVKLPMTNFNKVNIELCNRSEASNVKMKNLVVQSFN